MKASVTYAITVLIANKKQLKQGITANAKTIENSKWSPRWFRLNQRNAIRKYDQIVTALKLLRKK